MLTLHDVEHEQWWECLSTEDRLTVQTYEDLIAQGVEQADPDLVLRYQQIMEQES